MIAFRSFITCTFLAMATATPHVRSSSYKERLLQVDTITFGDLSPGDVVTTLSGVNVTASRVNGKDGAWVPAQAMILNSSAPPAGDVDLGTPNEGFDGPGIGAGGTNSSLFPNTEGHGNILIVSQDDVTPNDNRWGAKLTFYFDPPKEHLHSIGHLDNEGKSSSSYGTVP